MNDRPLPAECREIREKKIMGIAMEYAHEKKKPSEKYVGFDDIDSQWKRDRTWVRQHVFEDGEFVKDTGWQKFMPPRTWWRVWLMKLALK